MDLLLEPTSTAQSMCKRKVSKSLQRPSEKVVLQENTTVSDASFGRLIASHLTGKWSESLPNLVR